MNLDSRPNFFTPVFTRPVRGVAAGVSGRAGGVSTGLYASLNLGAAVGDEPEAVAENRRRAAAAGGFDLRAAVLGRQVHGGDVATVGRGDGGRGTGGGEGPVVDALATADDVALLVGVADCVPVFMAAADGRAVALAHAGWKGVLADVVPHALAALRGLGVAPEDVAAAVGPSIGPCCFAVGADVEARFAARYPASALGGRVDLRAAIAAQLRAAGVPGDLAPPPCTACSGAAYFSHRAAGGRPAGRMWAFLRRA
jgi:YfiH family protein